MSAHCAIEACTYSTPHVHCPQCGTANPAQAICSFHAPVDDWAVENRVWSDFIHRGIVPKRLPLSEREQIADESSSA